MSDWQIRIPYRDRSDLVLDAIHAARETMDDNEQRVVEVLATDALGRGVTTVGGLLDELDGLDRDQTRRRLDWAREKVGMVSATEADRRRADAIFERELERITAPPPSRWSEWQMCHGPNCDAFPVKETGVPAKVTVERWFCPQHKHLAQPGDLEEHEEPYIGVTPTGKPIPSAKEKARIEAWNRARQEKEKREERKREEFERREYEATRAARERYEETTVVSILGRRVRLSDGAIIE